MSGAFANLFTPIEIGNCSVRNRIVSTGHHTYLADGVPGDKLVAYHEARAEGGAGLIISEIVAVHETAEYSGDLLRAESPDVIPHYARLVDACHRHDTKLFAQLFHPGREILSAPGGMMPIAWAPSAVPNERFHIMPKPMPAELICDVIAGFGRTAALLAEAGYDGFEIVANHGYLPAQFLNPRTNLRDDAYGGNDVNRLRFLREVADSVRRSAGDRVVGLRISGSEFGSDGLSEHEVLSICKVIADDFDYISVTAGTSANLGGSVHISAPMGIAHGYTAPLAAAIRAETAVPIIVTGRINQPQIAEQIIADGQADLCGMTRAMICDPRLGRRAQAGQLDSIRACIACNQACIGRAHKGLPISCIQHPESGRETEFATPVPVKRRKKIIVAGGGPAGMKAASIAASRGHDVTLYEASKRLGGQVNLAQLLPGREEFGGLTGNLESEMRRDGAAVVTGTVVTPELVEESAADLVIVATGATPYRPVLDGLDDIGAITAWDVLDGSVDIGASVIIADWRADWIGLGLAEMLVVKGHHVRLCVNGAMAGETLQMYTRNHYVGRLHRRGVEIRTHLRLFGADENTVFFQDTLSGEPVVFDNVDSLVLSLGHRSVDTLSQALATAEIAHFTIGDSVTPRTAEEAVYEGLKAGWEI